MPTLRQRHQVTETPAVAHAIEVAARKWPGISRSKLLLLIVDVGASVLEAEQDAQEERRRSAIENTKGKYSEVFEEGYLDKLRKDWPE